MSIVDNSLLRLYDKLANLLYKIEKEEKLTVDEINYLKESGGWYIKDIEEIIFKNQNGTPLDNQEKEKLYQKLAHLDELKLDEEYIMPSTGFYR